MHKSIPVRDIGKNPLSFLEERHEEFLSKIGEQPFFRFVLLGTNNEQEILSEIIDTNNEKYLNFFKRLPRQRQSGWPQRTKWLKQPGKHCGLKLRLK